MATAQLASPLRLAAGALATPEQRRGNEAVGEMQLSVCGGLAAVGGGVETAAALAMRLAAEVNTCPHLRAARSRDAAATPAAVLGSCCSFGWKLLLLWSPAD